MITASTLSTRPVVLLVAQRGLAVGGVRIGSNGHFIAIFVSIAIAVGVIVVGVAEFGGLSIMVIVCIDSWG